MTIDLQNLFAGCAGMEAGTEDLSKYAEAAAKRDALEEKLKALQAEYEAAKKDVENIEQERAAALRKRERAEADGVIETVEERYARLLWYLEPAYAVADFAWLFLGVVPSAASCVASAFRQAWRKLVAKLSEIIRDATDIVGGKVETRPVDNTNLYPIEAYRVACRRLKKNLDTPIFTFRHECTKEDVEREYRALPSVALYQNLYNKSFAGHTKRMKRGRKRLEDDDEKMAVVQRVADKAGRSFWTIGEFQSLVADEIGTDGASTAKDWVAAWMKTHPGEVTLRNEKRRHSQRRDLKPVLSVGV